MYFRTFITGFACCLAGCVDHQWQDQSGCRNRIRTYGSVKSDLNPSVSAKFYKNGVSASTSYKTDLGTVGVNSKGETFAEWSTDTKPINLSGRAYSPQHYSARVEAKVRNYAAGVEYERDCSCAPQEPTFISNSPGRKLWSQDNINSAYSITSAKPVVVTKPTENIRHKLRRKATHILDRRTIYSRESMDSRNKEIQELYKESTVLLPYDIQKRMNDLSPLVDYLRQVSAKELKTPIDSLSDFEQIVCKIEERYRRNSLSFPADIHAAIVEKSPLAAACRVNAESEFAESVKSSHNLARRNRRISKFYRRLEMPIPKETQVRMNDKSDLAAYLYNWADKLLKKGEGSQVANVLLRSSKQVRARYERNDLQIPESIGNRMIDLYF